jgi:hypothetical protein
MSGTESLRDTIIPKSDQLNADTLLAGPITVTVTAVKRGTADQPIDVHITGGHQPWKPCKSMRRVLISAWGDNGGDWVGKSMTLYTDPSVKFGGVAVGGIRVSHLSDIASDLQLSLTATRGKRTPFTVRKLVIAQSEPLPPYDADQFKTNLSAWRAAIADKKLTAEQVISKAEQKGKLTDEQKAAIRAPIEGEAK